MPKIDPNFSTHVTRESGTKFVVHVHGNAIAAFVWLSTSLAMPPPDQGHSIGRFQENGFFFTPRECRCLGRYIRTYGLYSCATYDYGLCSYAPSRVSLPYGLYSYGIYTYDLRSHGPSRVPLPGQIHMYL